MKRMVIGFSRPNKFKIGSELIMKWTSSPFSHVYCRYEDAQGRDVVFHAAHGTVHLILYSNFIKENKTIFEFEVMMSDEEHQKLKDLYYEKAGLPYSTKAIMFIPIHDIAWDFGVYLKSEDDPGYICSELAGTILNSMYSIKFKKPYNILRPDDVYKALLENSEFKQITLE